MHQVPVIAKPVFARVLAHGRDKNTVGNGNARQLDGRE
jgi:hypothetical protein